MFEDLVSNLLSTYLGDYLEGLTKNDLKISLWKGDVELRNLRVRTESINFLNLPLQVKDGFVGKLTLKIPWKNLGKKPTMVFLDDVYVIACPKSELTFDEEKKKKREKENKRAQLKAIEENEQRYDEEMNAKQNNSSTAKLLAKIIDNFRLRINHIHLRFEDHSSCKDRSFCAGIILEKLHVESPTSELEEKGSVIPGVIDKKLKLSRLGIYWDFDQSLTIPTNSIEILQQCMEVPFLDHPSTKLQKYLPQHYILEPISLEFLLHIDIRKVELRKPLIEEVIQETIKQLHWEDNPNINKFKKCYMDIKQDGIRGRSQQEEWQLMHPRLVRKYPSLCSKEFVHQASLFCQTCYEIGNTPAPMVIVNGSMKELIIKLDQQQYRDILEFLSNLSIQTLKAKYKKYKPTHTDVVSHPREWWRFAIKSIQSDNQQKRKNSSWKEYLRFKRHREEYIELYKRKCSSKNGLKKDPQALARLQHLEDSLSLENILLFQKIANQEMVEVSKNKKKEKKKLTRQKTQSKENSFEWNEEKRNELLSEFDINPEETSPWEGGNPKDIQIKVDFHLSKIGLFLVNDKMKLLVCQLQNLYGRLYKRKEYIQFWCGIKSLTIEDGETTNNHWKRIIYAEENASLNHSNLQTFLPTDMMDLSTIPFLQVAVEYPSMTEDVDMTIRCTSLPLCIVGNVITIMNTVNFLLQDFSTVNLYGFKKNREEKMNLQEVKKIQKLKVSKEIKTHRYIAMDIIIGSIHLLLPENCNSPVEETQVFVFRFGDIYIHNHPTRIPSDTIITQDNVYDQYHLEVNSMNVLMTNYQKDWMIVDIQKQQHLCFFDDFTIQAIIGISIAPSETQYANCNVNVTVGILQLSMNQQQYEGLLGWMKGFMENVLGILESNKENVKELTAVANKMMNKMMKDDKEEEEEENQIEEVQNDEKKQLMKSIEEYEIVKENKLFEIHGCFEGIHLRIDQTCINDSLVELQINELKLGLLKRTYDMKMNISLDSILIEDNLRSRQIHKPCYLFGSQRLLEDGQFDSTISNELVVIDCTMINRNSPDFLTASSSFSIQIALGSIGLLLYRPTIYQLLQFFLPNDSNTIQNETPSSSTIKSSSLNVNIHTITTLQRLTKQLLSMKKQIPDDWLKNQLQLSISLQSASVLLLTDQQTRLYYGTIEVISLQIGICPAFVTIGIAIHDIAIKDCSEGAGYYSSILSIPDSQQQHDFIHLSLTVFSDTRYPHFPGYQFGIEGTINAPSINLRFRYIDEILKYLLIGPLADSLALLKKLHQSKLATQTKKKTLLSSLYESAVTLGKSMIVTVDQDNQLPFLLPYLHILLTNCVIHIPSSSISNEMIVFELGSVTLSNQQPSYIEEENHYLIQLSSLKDTLNTLNLQIQNMRIYSILPSSSNSILGGIEWNITVVISSIIQIAGHIGKLAIGCTEEQLLLLLHILNGNLKEKAICCEGELKKKVKEKKSLPSLANQVVQSIQQENDLTSHLTVAFSFVLDGLCIEYFTMTGGYDPLITSKEMIDQAGSQEHSFTVIDINQLQCFMNLIQETITIGMTLTSIQIKDTNHFSSIHSSYQTPLLFGGEKNHAISIIFSLQKKQAIDFSDVLESNLHLDEILPDIQLAIYIGQLRILPTPWIFSVLSILHSFQAKIKEEKQQQTYSLPDTITPSPIIQSTHQSKLLPNLSIDLRVDNPSIILIEDPTIPSTSAFFFSFSMDTSITISPLANIHTSISILNIRSCRGNPSQLILPEPSLFDSIHPFDINVNLHLTNSLHDIQGTISSTVVNVRIGLKDLHYFINTFKNLIPSEFFEKPVVDDSQSISSFSHFSQSTLSFDETPLSLQDQSYSFSHQITVFLSINKCSVILVNDTKDAEIPILQLSIHNLYSRMECTSDLCILTGEVHCGADAYNPILAVWEPFLEDWILQCKLEKEPRGRIIQKQSASSTSKWKYDTAITRLTFTIPTPMNLNLSSQFINILLQTIHSFNECTSTITKQGNNYYIALSNCTGIHGSYQVLKDGQFNELLFELYHTQQEEHCDDALFTGLALISIHSQLKTMWVEFHSLPPKIRVFSSIPFSRDSDKYYYYGDVIQTINKKESIYYQTISFVNQSENDTNETIIVFVNDEKESQLWNDHLRLMDFSSTSISIPSNDQLFEVNNLPSSHIPVVTALPAHPSLLFHYLNKPYQRTKDRLLSITLDGFLPFSCNIDHVTSQAIEVTTQEGDLIYVFIHSEVIAGQKQIILSSPIQVINQSHSSLYCGFYEDPSFLQPQLLQPEECLWSSYSNLEGGGLCIQKDTIKCLSMNRIFNEESNGIMNLGTSMNPYYISVYEKVNELPIKGKDQTIKQYSIILSDIMEFQNLLPECINYRVLNRNQEICASGSLQPGQSTTIPSCKFKRHDGYYISIQLPQSGYQYSDYSSSITIDKETGYCTMIHSETGHSLNLQYHAYYNNHHAWSVQLFCNYWIINKTGDLLVIRDEDQDQFTTLLPSAPLSLKTTSKSDLQSNDLVHLVLYDVSEKNKKASVQLAYPSHSQWSSPFSINTHGMSGQCSIRSDDKNKHEHMIAVQISRAPGIFAHTLVVTLTPLYMIVNQMNIPVKIKQQDSFEKIVLSPGSFTSFSWSSYEQPSKIEIQTEFMNYGWTKPLSIKPGHYCLQLFPPEKDDNHVISHEFSNLPNPIDQPSSILIVDIIPIHSQFYLFINQSSPSLMPFCISNDCPTDVFTIRQRGASWNTSIQLDSLSSRMWTLPEVEGEEIVDIYYHCIGALPSSTFIEPVLSVSLHTPGILGSIEISNPPHTVNIRLLIHKTTRILIFEHDSTENDLLTSFVQDKFNLLQITEDIDATINAINKHVSMYFDSLTCSPTCFFTYLRCMYVFDAYLINPSITSVFIEFSTENASGKTPTIVNSSLFFDYDLIIEANQIIRFTIHLMKDSTILLGYGFLDCSQYDSIETIYEVEVPFTTSSGEYIGSLYTHLFTTKFGQVAEFNYRKTYLETCLTQVKEILPRLNFECKQIKSQAHHSFNEIHTWQRHLLRAMKTGIYHEQSSLDLLTEASLEEEASIQEVNKNFCINIHSIQHIPIEHVFTPIYISIQIGNTILRTPTSHSYQPDSSISSSSEIVLKVCNSSFGCSFKLQDNQVIVSQVEKNSIASQMGITVGSILKSINQQTPSLDIDSILKQLKSNRLEKELVFIPFNSQNTQQLVFNQEILFPAQVSSSISSITLSIYEETEESDILLSSYTFTCNEHEEIDRDVICDNGFVLSFDTSWCLLSLHPDIMKIACQVNIEGLGISILHSKPYEIAYCSIGHILASFGAFENNKKYIEMKIQSFQIDNQLENCRYPVLLGSPIDLSTQNWLHFATIIQPYPSFLFIEYFSILIQEIHISFDSSFVLEILSLLQDIQIHSFSSQEQDSLKVLQKYSLFHNSLFIPSSVIHTSALYAEFLELQPILISLTCKIDPTHPITGSLLPNIPILIPIQALLDTVGTVLGNLDNAQIKLKSFITKDLLISQYDLISQLSSHYLKQVLFQIYRIIGSFTFLGNPVGLIESLGAGVSAFFYEPIHGLVQGPQQFVDGLGKGTKALVMNTSYGVLNTVSKLAGTVGDGISALTMNTEYKQNRASGKSGILYGVKEGVLGVYKDTVNGASKNGVLGAILGTGKGMIGLLCKPVAGVFDETSKALDTIKEATQVGVSLKRVRLPRYFYPDHVLTCYCNYLAIGQSILSQIRSSFSLSINEHYLIHIPDNRDNNLMLTSYHILLITENQTVLWCYEYSSIHSITPNYNCIEIILETSRLVVLVTNTSIASLFCQIINYIENHDDPSLLIRQIISSYENKQEIEEIELNDEMIADYDETVSYCAETPKEMEEYIPVSAVIVNVHQNSELIKNTMIKKVYDEYEIEITCDDPSVHWIIYRRYSEFEVLHKQLLQLKGRAFLKGMKLPPKQAEVFMKINKKMKDSRVEGLNTYLRILIGIPELLALPCVDAFLKADSIQSV